MTLKKIEQLFNTWRENRRHSQEQIPDELWQQVAKIYTSYSPSTLCRRLGLSSQQLTNAMEGDGFASFIPTGATAAEPTIEKATVCEFSLERRGARLTIKVPLSAFDRVLSKLSEHLPC